MSVFNAKSNKVVKIKRFELTDSERRELDGMFVKFHRVDFEEIRKRHGEVDDFEFSYVRITLQDGKVAVGEALLPILAGNSTELWSILFCPPGKITATREVHIIKDDNSSI